MPQRRTLPTVAAVSLYPGLLAAAVGTAWALHAFDVTEGIAVSGTVMAFGALIVLLERVLPARADWTVGREVLALDLTHTVLWHALLPSLLRGVFLGALASFGPRLLASVHLDVWPSAAPLLVQVFLALCVGELAAYAIHRFGHETSIGWRFHATHHSSDRLHALAAGRNHPLNVAFSYLGQVTPLLLLGVPTEVLALHAVFTGVNGPLQHANLDLRTGPLCWVFSTPDHHFWHHAVEVEHSNANYGSNVLVWDVLFGTKRVPSKGLPEEVGLPYAFPTSFLGQCAWPFSAAANALVVAEPSPHPAGGHADETAGIPSVASEVASPLPLSGAELGRALHLSHTDRRAAGGGRRVA